MNELRPKLFDVMKGYTKEQLIKDIISGIIVAIIALPLSIALAIASGVGPEHYRRIFYFFLRRKPRPDWWTNRSFCCDYLRNCRTVRN